MCLEEVSTPSPAAYGLGCGRRGAVRVKWGSTGWRGHCLCVLPAGGVVCPGLVRPVAAASCVALALGWALGGGIL